MPWFKVDDGFHAHRKVAKLGDDTDAIALWTLAGSWSANQLTDGWVPDYVVARIDAKHYVRRAAALVRVGLWEPAERDGETGWVFHGWSEPGRQPTSEQVNAERAATAERQRKYRERMKGLDQSNGVTNASVTQAGDASVIAPVPFPSVPFPSNEEAPSAPAAPDVNANQGMAPAKKPKRPPIEEPEWWAKFWGAYPRKKDKANAEKAWNKAIRNGADPSTILDGVLFYRLDCANKEAQYIKYPASWLNARGWQDEPDPQPKAPSAIGAPSEAASVQPPSFDSMRHEFTRPAAPQPDYDLDFGGFGRIPD